MVDRRLAAAVAALVLLFFAIVVMGQQYRTFHRGEHRLERAIARQASNYRLAALPDPRPRLATLLGISSQAVYPGTAKDYAPYPHMAIKVVDAYIARRNELWARVRAALPTASNHDPILNKIREAAAAHGVHHVKIGVSGTPHEFYRTTDLQLQMTGTLDSLGGTLHDIDGLARMKSWGRVSVRKLEGERRAVSVQLIVFSSTSNEPSLRQPVHLASCDTSIHGVWAPWLKSRLRALQERYRQVCRRQDLNPALALKLRELRRPDVLDYLLDQLSILWELQKIRQPLVLSF